MTPIDLISCLVTGKLTRRGGQLSERRRKQVGFRDALKTLDNFDFNLNKKMNRSLIFDLDTANFIGRREGALFLDPLHRQQSPGPGAGPGRYSTRLSRAYWETHTLLDELSDATIDGTRKDFVDS